jgi:hypothetical protein
MVPKLSKKQLKRARDQGFNLKFKVPPGEKLWHSSTALSHSIFWSRTGIPPPPCPRRPQGELEVRELVIDSRIECFRAEAYGKLRKNLIGLTKALYPSMGFERWALSAKETERSLLARSNPSSERTQQKQQQPADPLLPSQPAGGGSTADPVLKADLVRVGLSAMVAERIACQIGSAGTSAAAAVVGRTQRERQLAASSASSSLGKVAMSRTWKGADGKSDDTVTLVLPIERGKKCSVAIPGKVYDKLSELFQRQRTLGMGVDGGGVGIDGSRGDKRKRDDDDDEERNDALRTKRKKEAKKEKKEKEAKKEKEKEAKKEKKEKEAKKEKEEKEAKKEKKEKEAKKEKKEKEAKKEKKEKEAKKEKEEKEAKKEKKEKEAKKEKKDKNPKKKEQHEDGDDNQVKHQKKSQQMSASSQSIVLAPYTKEVLDTAIFKLLLRYDTLGASGFQAALPPVAFDALQAVFGIQMECFASPLNSYYEKFCSAFFDTDEAFGSVGSFFHFRPTTGSYEVNPPFAPGIIRGAIDHIEELLSESGEDSNGKDGKSVKKEKSGEGRKSGQGDKSGKRSKQLPLSFAVVVPVWEDSEAWQLLRACRFLRGEIRVPKERHAWRDYRAGGLARRVPVDTGLFFLQNDQGALKWPCTTASLAQVEDALLMAPA